MWFPVLAPLAFAAPADAADPPLAIPEERDAPDATEETAGPASRPLLTARQRGAALAAYRQRAVSVRHYATLQRGTATAVGWGWGWPGFGSPYGGFSTTYIVGSPTYTIERWAVYAGNHRLSVPEWLDLAASDIGDRPVPLDALDARDDLRRRVRRTRTWHNILLGTAIAGGVAAVGSSWAAQSADSYEEYEDWRIASSAGGSAVVVGVVGAFATGLHARSLRYDFDRSQDLTATQDRVRATNSALRSELGLSRDDTAEIDRGEAW